MKALLFLTLFITGTAFAQTNVIAAKSHASSTAIDKNDTDNFGEIAPVRYILEVIYWKGDCIVEKYEVRWDNHGTEYDTICQHPFLQNGTVDLERIKAMYPEGTVFKDFDKVGDKSTKTKKELRKEKKGKRSEQSNALLFFLVGGGLFLTFLFTPKNSLRTS